MRKDNPENESDKEEDAKKSATTKKVIRIITVIAYVSGVSGTGFLMSLYYLIFWDPQIKAVRPPGYNYLKGSPDGVPSSVPGDREQILRPRRAALDPSQEEKIAANLRMILKVIASDHDLYGNDFKGGERARHGTALDGNEVAQSMNEDKATKSDYRNSRNGTEGATNEIDHSFGTSESHSQTRETELPSFSYESLPLLTDNDAGIVAKDYDDDEINYLQLNHPGDMGQREKAEGTSFRNLQNLNPFEEQHRKVIRHSALPIRQQNPQQQQPYDQQQRERLQQLEPELQYH